MGRKTQITKELILETALQMLLREGYGSINVKTLAAEIGCSTQPIVWHFENMTGFRSAFFEYCIAFAQSQFTPWGGSLDDLLAETARGYITIACNMPHLFRFVFADSREDCRGAAVQKMQRDSTEKILELLCREKAMTQTQAETFLLNYEFYIHGIASYAAGGFVNDPEEKIIAMANRAKDAFLAYELGEQGRGM
jgi:AcrR family transcriptional regulator